MDRKKLNKLAMYIGVWRFLADVSRAQAVGKIEAFAEDFAAFSLLVPQMRRASRLARELESEGETETKASIRAELADEAARISAGVVTFADTTGDLALASSAHVTRSMILGGRELDAAELADNLLAAALARVGSLGKFGVTRDMLDEFDELTQSFSEAIGRPREVIQNRKHANSTLPELFEAADLRLGRMDKLTELIEKSHPEFVSLYRERRRIIRQAATRTLSALEKANAAARQPTSTRASRQTGPAATSSAEANGSELPG